MLKKHATLFESILIIIDLLVVSASWLASYWIRFHSGYFEIDKGVPPFFDYFKNLIFVLFIWFAVFKNAGLYKPMRTKSRSAELGLIFRSNILSVIILLSITYLFWEKSVPFSRVVFFIFLVVSLFLLFISRAILREVLRNLRRRGFNLRYSLIVGTGDVADRIYQRLQAHKEYGIKVVGVLASPDLINELGMSGAKDELDLLSNSYQLNSMRIVGTYGDLDKILAIYDIDQIFIALAPDQYREVEEILSMIGDRMIDIKIVPDMLRFIQLGSQIEDFDGLPVMSIASTPLSGNNLIIKRIFDFILGLVIFILISPVYLLIALLVKITSKGPMYYVQERVGLDGNKFHIIKFRTMRTDAEVEGAKFATKGDNRTTPIGKYLRKFSLDELPQLINVIRGEMSLVGPRPEREIFINDFRKKFPRYMLRHKVQAGMTGWAQINGWRGDTSIEKRVEYDLYYIENWSILLDLKIIFLTIFKVFMDENAY